MRALRTLSPWVLSALLLAACGGGDPTVPGSGSPSGAPTTKGSFTAVVSFGDSWSDVGTYSPTTSLAGNAQPPYFGGKFTTNATSNGLPDANALGKVWVEVLAASLGIIVTPAEVGWDGVSVKCPAAAVPAYASTCTAYGQGGARVTSPDGIGHNPVDGKGALTVPVVTQIANHLQRFKTFKDSDLILVWGGANDMLTQIGAFGAKAAQIQADALAGKLTADEANRALFNAQATAQAGMQTAALQLADYVKTQILANGGKYVAVVNLPNGASSPFGQSLPAALQPVLTELAEIFNLWLQDGLTGQPVQIIDTFSLFADLQANPAKFGFVNNTTPACDAAKISVITGGAMTTGSSLFCNATPGAPYNGLTTGADVTTWFYADGVHPTTGGHKAWSDIFTAQLHAFGWI